jgi:hypothetical protein
LKIEIKESKWQDQLPKKLMDMLSDMSKTRNRKIIHFKVTNRPVVQFTTPI